MEALSPVERRLRWSFLGRSGCTTFTALRSGIVMSASAVQWDQPWSVSVEQTYTPLKLILLRGRAPRVTTSDGDDQTLTGGMFRVARVNRPVHLTFAFDELSVTAQHEELSVEIQRNGSASSFHWTERDLVLIAANRGLLIEPCELLLLAGKPIAEPVVHSCIRRQ